MLQGSPVLASLVYAGGAAAATALGAGLASTGRMRQGRLFDALMAASAGILMGLSVFSLVLPAGQLLVPQMGDLALVGTLLGGLVLGALGLVVMRRGSALVPVQAGPWLVLLGLVLHDIPEGFAIGTAVGAPQVAFALPVAAGIALQNLLDGAAAVVAARAFGWSAPRAAVLVALAGLVEVGSSLVATGGMGLLPGLRPFILLGTGGAMIELVRSEIVPSLRSHARLPWGAVLACGVVLIPLVGYWLLR